MSRITQTIGGATLAMSLAFGSVAAADNATELGTCHGDASITWMNSMLDSSLETAREAASAGAPMTQAELDTLMDTLVPELNTVLLQCAVNVTGIPADQWPDPQTPEFEAMVLENVDAEIYEQALSAALEPGAMAAIPRMLELQSLTQD